MRSLVMVFLAVAISFAQADEAFHYFSQDISVEQGCAQAEKRLQRQALISQCGSRISGIAARLLDINHDSLSVFELEAFKGLVRTQGVFSRTVEFVNPPESNQMLCRVQGEVTVSCGKENRDDEFNPDFPYALSLNNYHYEQGDPVYLDVRASSDLYLNIVQVLPDQNLVSRVIPNAFRENLRLRQGESRQLPSNHQWIAELPKGQENSTEYLIAIASKQPILAPMESTVGDFFNWLMTIPESTRREALLSYRISKSGSNTSRPMSQTLKGDG